MPGSAIETNLKELEQLETGVKGLWDGVQTGEVGRDKALTYVEEYRRVADHDLKAYTGSARLAEAHSTLDTVAAHFDM